MTPSEKELARTRSFWAQQIAELREKETLMFDGAIERRGLAVGQVLELYCTGRANPPRIMVTEINLWPSCWGYDTVEDDGTAVTLRVTGVLVTKAGKLHARRSTLDFNSTGIEGQFNRIGQHKWIESLGADRTAHHRLKAAGYASGGSKVEINGEAT